MDLDHLQNIGFFADGHSSAAALSEKVLGLSAPTGRCMDSFGIEISTSDCKCAAAIGDYYQAVLSYRPFAAWAIADQAVVSDAACPLAYVLAADYAFCRGDAAAAKASLATLTATVSDVQVTWTWREQRYIEAWRRWVEDGDPVGCYAELLCVVQKHPMDLFAVKRGQIMALILGDGARSLTIVEAAAAEVTEPGRAPRYLHGMWAFGLEQNERYEEAEAKAREGLALPGQLGKDAWLDHGLAHALYFQGDDQLEDAIEFLESQSSQWQKEELHPFLYTHNWWHLSLLYCESREIEDSLRIFDTRLWADADADMRVDPTVQGNALNLLWRLETRGASAAIGGRWAKVLASCENVTLPAPGCSKAPAQHSDLLLDVLLVRALCACGSSEVKRLEAFLSAVEAHAAELQLSDSAGAKARGSAYAAIVQSIAALFRRDGSEAGAPAREAAARKELKTLRPWEAVGGSAEQRGVLLEAVEGPVVCGAPEKNFSTLFFD